MGLPANAIQIATLPSSIIYEVEGYSGSVAYTTLYGVSGSNVMQLGSYQNISGVGVLGIVNGRLVYQVEEYVSTSSGWVTTVYSTDGNLTDTQVLESLSDVAGIAISATTNSDLYFHVETYSVAGEQTNVYATNATTDGSHVLVTLGGATGVSDVAEDFVSDGFAVAFEVLETTVSNNVISYTTRIYESADNSGSAQLIATIPNSFGVIFPAPLLTNGQNVSVQVGNTVAIVGFGILDYDTGAMTATVTSIDGVVNASASGATLTGSNSSRMTISGTLSQINQALASLSFNGTTPGNGSVSVVASYNGVSSSTQTSSVNVTAVQPTVSSVTSNPVNAYLNAGKIVTLTLNFNEAVYVTGSPSLTLNDGGVAGYVSGSGSTALNFSYTVQPGQNTAALSISAVSLNGGSIVDGMGHVANLTSAATRPAGTVVIDTTRPTILSVTTPPPVIVIAIVIIPPSNPTVTITLNASEALSVSGAPILLLSDGGVATYTSGSGTNSLVFTYNIPSGQGTGDLKVIGVELPAAGAISDLAGNPAILSGAAADLKISIGSGNTSTSQITISGSQAAEITNASTANVVFASGSTGELLLDTPNSFTGSIAGFNFGENIDLLNSPYQGGISETYVANTGGIVGGVLNVGSAHIQMSGVYSTIDFALSSDGYGGTDIVLRAVPPELPAMVFFQNTSGAVVAWNVANSLNSGGVTFGNPGQSWTMLGVGHFYDTDEPDILFENAGGMYALWQTDGQQVIGGGNIGSPGGTWQFKAIGDFNGDGKSDLLFEDAGGDYATWNLSGTSIIGGGTIGNPGSDWTFEAAADFNGDGTTDLLFVNTSGAYAIWDIANNQIVGGGTVGTPGSNWTFLGAGDFNGDGKADLLFENDSGTYATWDLSGSEIVGGGTLGNPGPNWKFEGIADLNGSHESAILFENTSNGEYWTWQLNDTSVVGAGNLGSAGAQWTLKAFV